jgi:LCP family protein required for cell wall assembly
MDENAINFLEEQNPAEENNGRSKKRSIFFIALFAFLLIIGGCLAYRLTTTAAPQNPTDFDPVTLEPKKPEGLLQRLGYLVFGHETKLAGEQKDRINILLLGMGGVGHDGPYLTDTIMIASIKPSTNQIALISIPRDLGVDIPGRGVDKINLVNSLGETTKPNWGGAHAAEIIAQTLNIELNYYLRLDFRAFKEIIDEVGGITVNVDRSFTDQMYPDENYGYQTVQFVAGIQTMDGERALKYSRSRHGSNGEGSDFGRAKRQQKVILALKEKILSFGTLANPIRINNVIKALDKHLTTNMEFADIISLLKLARKLDTDNILRLTLDDSPTGYLKSGYNSSGAYILTPIDGNFDKINQIIENIFTQDLTVKNDTPAQGGAPKYSPANVEIQNGTWRAGLASRLKKRLEDRGFIIETVGNTAERPKTESGIYRLSEKEVTDVMQGLQQELHIPIKQSLPPNIQATSTSDVLVLLGEDIEE